MFTSDSILDTTEDKSKTLVFIEDIDALKEELIRVIEFEFWFISDFTEEENVEYEEVNVFRENLTSSTYTFGAA